MSKGLLLYIQFRTEKTELQITRPSEWSPTPTYPLTDTGHRST